MEAARVLVRYRSVSGSAPTVPLFRITLDEATCMNNWGNP